MYTLVEVLVRFTWLLPCSSISQMSPPGPQLISQSSCHTNRMPPQLGVSSPEPQVHSSSTQVEPTGRRCLGARQWPGQARSPSAAVGSQSSPASTCPLPHVHP